MLWYQVWVRQITPVEIEKATEKTVTLKGGRRQSRDSWQFFAPTWEEAHAHLLAEAETSVRLAQQTLDRAKSHLGSAKVMKAPTQASDAGEQ